MHHDDPTVQFQELSRNYLSMLATAPTEADDSAAMPPPPVPVAAAPQPPVAPSAAAMEADLNAMLEDMIKASPSMQDFTSPPQTMPYQSFDASPYLTSPLFEDFDPTSPLFGGSAHDFTSPMITQEDYHPSPYIGDAHDFYNSPLIVDHPGDNGLNFMDMPLFSNDGRPLIPPSTPALVNDTSPLLMDSSSPQLATPLNAVGSYDPIVSDGPSLFPDFADSFGAAAIQNKAPQASTSTSTPTMSASPSARPTKSLPVRPQGIRRVTPTGTRRNITPNALIPEDAPTQVRTYSLPSSTSRKEVPVTFARKRVAQAIADDDEILPDLPPNATEKEQIEWKRRQNTIAARKSRKRKLEHQQNLETELEQVKRDRDVWRVRALTLRGVLRGKGEDASMADWDNEETS